jgi:hypothetical protein
MYPIYISAHHDDVCFSIGQLCQRLGGGSLLNVFSLSNYTHESLCIPGDVNHVSALRDKEDAAFASLCGLRRINLELLDAPLRGRRPFDKSERENEGKLIGPRLMNATLELLARCSLVELVGRFYSARWA